VSKCGLCISIYRDTRLSAPTTSHCIERLCERREKRRELVELMSTSPSPSPPHPHSHSHSQSSSSSGTFSGQAWDTLLLSPPHYPHGLATPIHKAWRYRQEASQDDEEGKGNERAHCALTLFIMCFIIRRVVLLPELCSTLEPPYTTIGVLECHDKSTDFRSDHCG
jgi:hypothetical protein